MKAEFFPSQGFSSLYEVRALYGGNLLTRSPVIEKLISSLNTFTETSRLGFNQATVHHSLAKFTYRISPHTISKNDTIIILF